MNDMIKQMVQPLLDAFDAYTISSDAVKTEVENFKKELADFAEGFDDFMQYYNEFSSSSLQEKYTDLISKVATMSYAADAAADSGADAAATDSDADAATSSAPSISVRDFLEQYRVPYGEVKKRDSRASKVYEEIFAIADKTDDMIEAQLILEKERLLWRIVKEDALDTFERKLEEMDPLYLATTAVLLSQIAAYNKVSSEEELVYELTISEQENYKIISDYIIKMNLAAMLAKEVVEYIKAKEMVYDWVNDNSARSGAATMISKKKNIQSIVKFFDVQLGISIDDLFDDPGVAIWMLSPQNLDEYGRRKKVLVPENLELFKDVLGNEILKDIKACDALLR